MDNETPKLTFRLAPNGQHLVVSGGEMVGERLVIPAKQDYEGKIYLQGKSCLPLDLKNMSRTNRLMVKLSSPTNSSLNHNDAYQKKASACRG